ncbi:MAG: hypothetical protein JXA22_00290 [Candidatus Thermoplasmatota archaeon]|nr:hypothetical protein [Candidatus Thermoplasmatota archaeon]
MHEMNGYKPVALIAAVVVLVCGSLMLGMEAEAVGSPFTGSSTLTWDTESPTYQLLSPPEDEYQLDPFQIVRIQLQDDGSGVDAGSIEYRLTTQGLSHWSQWMPYRDADDGTTTCVTLRERFRRGDDNYIQVRASDIAGNPISVSRPYKVRINTCPEVIIVSPSAGDQIIEGEIIDLDASMSYDRDGDDLDFEWYRSTPLGCVLIGDSEQISCTLPAGEHTITVIATDEVNNQGRAYLTIRVSEEISRARSGEDTDRDGIPDAWELRFQLDPLKDDSYLDPDGDGFTSLQEYQSSTNPRNEISKPPMISGAVSEDDIELFSVGAWPLWALLVFLILVVLLTMAVVKSKNDRQVTRINRIRSLRSITPSVSWEHVTVAATLGPLTGGLTTPAVNGPRLQAAPPVHVPAEHVVLPAIEIERRQTSPAPIEEPAMAPAQEVHSSQAGNIPPPGRWPVDGSTRPDRTVSNGTMIEEWIDACGDLSGALSGTGSRAIPFGHVPFKVFSVEDHFPGIPSCSLFYSIEVSKDPRRRYKK